MPAEAPHEENLDISVGLIIDRLMKKRGLKEADLSRILKLPQTTLNRLRLQDHADPRISTLKPIAKFFGVTLGQLAGIEAITDTDIIDASDIDIRCEAMHLPNISWSSISAWLQGSLTPSSSTLIRWACTERKLNSKAFVLESRPFMAPAFPSHSSLIVDPAVAPTDGQNVIVCLSSGEPTARKVMKDGADVYFKPFDPMLPMLRQEASHTILGTIVEARIDFAQAG